MKVTFDKDGYVEMLIKKGDLPNSIELEDDDTIDFKYLNCYQLGYDGTQLVLDAKKVQRVENNSAAETLIYDLTKQVNATDYKVLRHIREKALGIPTSMSENDYLMLEAERESLVRRIREIQDGSKLETDVFAIMQEGYLTRESNKDNTIKITVSEPEMTIEEIVGIAEEIVEEPVTKSTKKTKKATSSEK